MDTLRGAGATASTPTTAIHITIAAHWKKVKGASLGVELEVHHPTFLGSFQGFFRDAFGRTTSGRWRHGPCAAQQRSVQHKPSQQNAQENEKKERKESMVTF